MEEKQRMKVKILYCLFKDSNRNGKFKKIGTGFEINKRYILRDRELNSYIEKYLDEDEFIYKEIKSQNITDEEKMVIKKWFNLINEKVDNNIIELHDLQNVPNLLKKIYEWKFTNKN